MKKIFALAVLAVLAASPALAGVQAGNWQFTVDVSLSQGDASGPIVRTRCVSESEANDPRKVFADAGQSGCEFSDTQDTGAQYTFSVECKGGPIPVHGSGRIDYTAQTLDGVIDLIADQPNVRIVTHSTVKGRRLGSCNS